MPRLLAAFPAVAGLQQIVDRIGGGVDVYSALGVIRASVQKHQAAFRPQNLHVEARRSVVQ